MHRFGCEIDETDEMLFSAHLFMLYGKQSTRERWEMGEKTANILRYAHKKNMKKRGVETLWFQ
jgi:hypothetical protein